MRNLFMFVAAVTIGMVLLVSHSSQSQSLNKIGSHKFNPGGGLGNSQVISDNIFSGSLVKNNSKPIYILHRKLMTSGSEANDKCLTNPISFAQAETPRQPNGIPTFEVDITNTCASNCVIYGIHLKCGGFSSQNLIKPRIFKHIPKSDLCLINNGNPLRPGQVVSFRYTTNFKYAFSVATVKCHPPRGGPVGV